MDEKDATKMREAIHGLKNELKTNRRLLVGSARRLLESIRVVSARSARPIDIAEVVCLACDAVVRAADAQYAND